MHRPISRRKPQVSLFPLYISNYLTSPHRRNVTSDTRRDIERRRERQKERERQRERQRERDREAK